MSWLVPIRVMSKGEDATGEDMHFCQTDMCGLKTASGLSCPESPVGSDNMRESFWRVVGIPNLNDQCRVSTALLIVYQFDGLTMEQ
jgi:hypothetical protein